MPVRSLDDLSHALAVQHRRLLLVTTTNVERIVAAGVIDDPSTWPAARTVLSGAVRAAAVNVAGYANAYARHAAEEAPRGVVKAADVWAAVDVERWEKAPALRYLHLLAEGMEAGAARHAAISEAGRQSSLEVQHAQRRAFGQLESAGAGRPVRRIPNAGACGFCRVVADRMYNKVSDVQLHGNCRCSTGYVDPAGEWEPGQLGRGKWQDVIGERATTPGSVRIPSPPQE